jgi:hypothetical protein
MLLAVYFAAALLILLRGLFVAINRMGRHTAAATRAAWLLLTTGAVDIVVGPLFGRVPAPTYGDALLLAALAWCVLWRDGGLADKKGEQS